MMLKDIVYAGMGAAALLKERVEDEIKKLEESGKLKKDDAKNFLQKIQDKGKEEDERAKEHLKKLLKEVIDELGIATKEDLLKLKEELK